MAVDGRVPIVERLILHNPADAVPVLLSDLNMLILAGGQEPTLSLPNTASSWPRLA